jgi:hypothetical protein
MQSKAATVAEYLAALPEDRRAAISAVRDVILASRRAITAPRNSPCPSPGWPRRVAATIRRVPAQRYLERYKLIDPRASSAEG